MESTWCTSQGIQLIPSLKLILVLSVLCTEPSRSLWPDCILFKFLSKFKLSYLTQSLLSFLNILVYSFSQPICFEGLFLLDTVLLHIKDTWLSKDHLPSPTPPKLTDKGRRVTSKKYLKFQEYRSEGFAFSCLHHTFIPKEFTSPSISHQSSFPSYLQRKDSSQAVRINALLFHGLPLGLSLVMHTFFAPDLDCVLRRGTAVSPVPVPAPSVFLRDYSTDITHLLYLRLAVVSSWLIGFYELEQLTIFVFISDFQFPQRSLLFLQAVT